MVPTVHLRFPNLIDHATHRLPHPASPEKGETEHETDSHNMRRITSGRRIVNGVPFVWSILDNAWVTEEYWRETKKAQKPASTTESPTNAATSPTNTQVPPTPQQLQLLAKMLENLQQGLCTLDEYLQHVCAILERPYDG